MNIQWYPGHMAKAKRMLQENLKLIDVVAEIIDARAPAASRNPDFDSLFCGKERIVLLNKSDLADDRAVKEWIRYFESHNIQASGIVSTSNAGKKQAVALMEKAAAPMVERMKAKGVRKTVRVLVAGIPNVGKSTFINRIAGSARAQVGDKPGVTKGKQWVHINDYLELMDTPGLLWPKLENDLYAKHLAYLGSIKDDIMNIEELAASLISELLLICPDAVTGRYPTVTAETDSVLYLQNIAKQRGYIVSGNEPDTERAAKMVLDEFRAGKIAHVTFESPSEETLL